MQTHATAPERVLAMPRIVVIDDEPANLQIVRIIMMRENFSSELLLFGDGGEALSYLEQDPAVDLILLDLSMPDMDGFDVLEALKASEATAPIPVIILSAYQDTEYILKGFEMGATDFIGKPIISPILTARIHAELRTQALQHELRLRNEELVNINRLKDELISICSHDLRSPLSSIELLCQFLGDAVAGRSERSPPELINRVLNQSRLARRLVDNLLDLHRIEEGILVPSPSFFGAADMVRECFEDEETVLQARNIEASLALPEEDVVCFGDREMLAQVLRNLLGNAIKFTRSRVSLQCSLADCTEEAGGTLRAVIGDDGEGVPESLQQSVFDKYAKADMQSGGSGLGLFISRKMVELHGGSISLHSQPGLHTEFIVSLPNAFRREQLPELSALADAPVAVISTSKVAAELLEGLLGEAGMVQISTVVSHALPGEALGRARPALAVLDLQGPVNDTEALAASINSARETAWLVLAPAALLDTLQSQLRAPHSVLENDLNPLRLLRAAHALLEQPQRNQATAGG